MYIFFSVLTVVLSVVFIFSIITIREHKAVTPLHFLWSILVTFAFALLILAFVQMFFEGFKR